jgi:hypothetical protein
LSATLHEVKSEIDLFENYLQEKTIHFNFEQKTLFAVSVLIQANMAPHFSKHRKPTIKRRNAHSGPGRSGGNVRT